MSDDATPGNVPLSDRLGLVPEHAEWEHLKPYGYAPGHYLNRCHACNQVTTDTDKRAITCRPCAEAMHRDCGAVAPDAASVRRELMALARRDVIADRDRTLIGVAIGLIGVA